MVEHESPNRAENEAKMQHNGIYFNELGTSMTPRYDNLELKHRQLSAECRKNKKMRQLHSAQRKQQDRRETIKNLFIFMAIVALIGGAIAWVLYQSYSIDKAIDQHLQQPVEYVQLEDGSLVHEGYVQAMCYREAHPEQFLLQQ